MNNKNRKNKFHSTHSIIRLARSFRQQRMRVALWSFAILGFLLLLLMPTISSALPLTDRDKFDRVWQTAQSVGAYDFETDVLQTTLPSLSVENLGQTPQRSKVNLSGAVNTKEELLTFDLDTPQGVLEIRVQEGIAYGREKLGPDTPWIKLDAAPQLFAPGNDVQGYASAATGVVKVENWREVESLDAITQLHVETATEMFAFTVDGEKLANQALAQQEEALIKNGEIAPGQQLGQSAEIAQINGTGRLWIDEAGLPLYQVLDLNLPPQNHTVGRTEIEMHTAFGGWEAGNSATSIWGSVSRLYDNPSILTSDPVSLIPNAYSLTSEFVEAVLIIIGVFTLISAITLLIIRLIQLGQFRKIYNVTAVTMIVAMVITPFVQVGSLYAYSDRYDARHASNGGAELFSSEPSAAEKFTTELASNLNQTSEGFNPRVNPLANDSDDALLEVSEEPVAAIADLPVSSGPEAITLQVTCFITDTDADCDGDGLTNGTELLRLGTDPESVDSDEDFISDGREVAGFTVDGQIWYLDPTSPDSNQDQIIDGIECPTMYDIDENGEIETEPATPFSDCADDDGDGVPNVFDFDNDGDGVHDVIDASPFFNDSISTQEQDYVGLTISNYDVGESLLVEYQIRPSDPAMLWHNATTINWGEDMRGQVTKVVDQELALTPYLEISIPYPGANQDNVVGSLPISPTINYADVLDDYFSGQTGGGGDAPLITDWLNSGYLGKHGVNVYQDDEGVIDSPNDDKLTALVPLIDILDPVGNSPIAWSGTMLYQPQVADWGAEHEVRLVWYLSGRNDYCDTNDYDENTHGSESKYCRDASRWKTRTEPTVFVNYDDQFTVSGMRISEFESVKTAAIVQNDALNPTAGYEEDLWRLADGLTQSFIPGRVITKATGTYTTDDRFDITDVKDRFDNEGSDPFANDDPELWGITNGQLTVQMTTTLKDNILGLEQLIADRDELLSTTFSSQAAISDTVSVLFLREEAARYAILDEDTTTVSGNSINIDMSDQLDSVTAVMNVYPYDYAGPNGEQEWIPTDMATYVVTELEPTLRNLTDVDDLIFLADEGEVINDAAGITVAYAIFASNFYMKLYDGFSSMVELDNNLIYDTTGLPDDYALFDRDILLSPDIPAFLSLADGVVSMMVSILEFHATLGLGEETYGNKTVTIPDKFEFAEVLTVGERVDALIDPSNDSNITLIERSDILLTQIQLIIMDYDKFAKWFKATPNIANKKFNRIRDVGHVGMALGAVVRLAGPATGLSPTAATAIALTLELPGAIYSTIDSILSLKSISALKESSNLFVGTKFQSGFLSQIKAIKSATKFSVIFGFVLSTAVIIGMTAYAIAANDVKPGSIEFNFLITKGAIAIAVEVIFLILALFIPIGTVIFIIIQLIDLIAAAVCEIYEAVNGDDSISDPVNNWVCNGIGGAIAEILTYAIHDTWLSVDTSQEGRLGIEFNTPEILTDDGFKAGAEVEIGFTIVSTITLNEPDEGIIKNSRATLNIAKVMRGSSFDYFLQTEELDQHEDLGFDQTDWTPIGGDWGKKAVETFNPSDVFTFNKAGQNQTPGDLYLTESFNIVNYECWGFIGTSEGTCKRHAQKGSSHIPLDRIYFDIFPADIDDFIVSRSGDVISWIEGGGLFQPFQDFDGDGLLPYSGGDPDTRSPDMDDDGLSDSWEIANGTDERQADRDNDGLSDYWEIFYNTNPYRADTDGDGMLDGEEFFHSQTDYPWQAESEPWTGGWAITYDVDVNGNDLVTIVSANPTAADTDLDGMFDTDERFFGYNPTVLSQLNPLAIEGEIKTNSQQVGIVGLDDSVTFTATVENQDTFLHSLTANLDVEIPAGSLQSTQSIGTLAYGDRATVSDTAGVGNVNATTFTSVTLRAEGVFLDDFGVAPSNIGQVPLVDFGFNEPQNAGTFSNDGSLGGSGTCNIAQGNGNEGCPYTGAPGKNGNAIFLDANRHQIDYTDAGLAINSYTIGFWYKQTNYSRNAELLTWGDHVITVTGAGANSVIWRFAEDDGGSCANNIELSTMNDIQDDRWIHVMFAHDYDGANSNLSLYVNGDLKESTSSATAGSCLTGMDDFDIYAGWGNGRLHTLLDDFQIYGSSLSATDVATLYNYQFSQFDTAKNYPITIDATGPETALASNADIKNDITVMAVKAVDDLSVVRGVTVTITAPDNVVEVIVPEQKVSEPALWSFYFEPTIEGEYTFTIDAIDSVNNSTTNIDRLFVDDTPPVVDLDGSLESGVLSTAADDLRDPNSIDLFGTVTDNRTIEDRVEIDLRDWQGESVSDSRVVSVTINNQNDSLGTWLHNYQLPGSLYGQYDVFAHAVDATGNAVSGTIGTLEIDDFGPWSDITIDQESISQPGISGTVSDLRYNVLNRVVHFHFEEAAGATTFIGGTQYQHTASCSGATCPTAGEAGQYGNAVQFDGIDDSLPVAEREFSIENGATAMAWVQPTWASGSQGYNPIILDVEDGNEGFSFEIADDYSALVVRTVTETLSVPVSINPNEWTHVAMTIDPVGAWTGYVNGIATGTISQTFGTTDALSVTIGSNFDGSDNFEGLLDEVIVYDYPVSDDIIYNFANPLATNVTQVEYQAREINGSVWPGVDSDGLQFYLPLDDPFGSTSIEYNSYTNEDISGAATCDDEQVYTDDEIYALSNWSEETWEFVYGYPVSELPNTDITYTVDTCPTAGVDGKFGTAFDMGIAQRVEISGTQDLNLSDMSVSFWFKSESPRLVNFDLITKGDSWRIFAGPSFQSDDGRLVFETPGVQNVGGGTIYAIPTASELNDGEWHHIVAMIDGPYRRLYVDGVLNDEALVFGAFETNTEPIVIGDETVAASGQAVLDEIAVFDRGLSEEEIAILGSHNPWQTATMASPNSMFSTWSADLSPELEGLYTIALRGTDNLGNQRVTPLGWHGPIDLKAPELELTFKHLSDDLYQVYCKATDLNISTDGWDCPAGEPSTEFRNNKDWYIDYFSPVTRTVGLASTPTTLITTTQAISYTACDLYGNCATTSATATQDAAGVAILSPVNGTQLTNFDPVQITGVSWADPDRDGRNWFGNPISGDFLNWVEVYVNGELIDYKTYSFYDRIRRDEWSVTWQPEPGVAEFEITVRSRSFFDAVQQAGWLTDASDTIVYAPTLAVSKDLNSSIADTGETITYTVVVENNGTRDLVGVNVQDSLPVGVTPLGATGDISETIDLLVGQGVTYTIPVQVTAIEGETVTNTVSVDHVTSFDTAEATFTVCEEVYTVTTNSLSGAGSFADGVDKVCPNGIINFSGDTVIIWQSGFVIDKPITIDGSGHIVNFEANFGTDEPLFIINVAGEEVALNDVTIKKSAFVEAPSYNVLEVNASAELLLTRVAIFGTGNFVEANPLFLNDGKMRLVNSRLNGFADFEGDIDEFVNNGTLVLINSIFQSGIDNSETGVVNLNYSTLVGRINNEGSVTLNSSIFLAADDEDGDGVNSCQGSGSFEDLGYNILSNDGSCPIIYTSTQTISPTLLYTDLLEEVGPFSGGNSADLITFELAENSIALDQIPPRANDCGEFIIDDQQGVARPQNGLCDVGALEEPGDNTAPTVEAGFNVTITLPATAVLDGTVIDDGLPLTSTLTTLWTQISGPGTTTFGDDTVVDTTASFSTAGTYVLQLAADDGTLIASDTVTVIVTGGVANVAPVAVDDSESTDSLTPVTINLLLNDTDADGDTLFMDAVTQPSSGSVVINNDDTITFTPDPSFGGTVTFTYTATDGSLTSNSATVTIGVSLVVGDGDVSCDATTNTVDGLFILQFNVGLRNATSSCPLADSTTELNTAVCDVNGDLTCNTVDALFILQCNVGINNAFCPAP